jgi:beta-phosphoglucomutase-like phosphatase (HAD superfamily)/dTDP-glucose pyrophosphorylase
MKKKLAIFDLDGVLIDTPNMHYKTFSTAYKKFTDIIITKKEHDLDLNGRSTKDKLNILQKRDNITNEVCENIWSEKQKLTWEYIESEVQIDLSKIELLEFLKSNNFSIVCASNAIKKTIELILNKMKIYQYFDLILSNEDTKNPKPSSEIYLKAMLILDSNPANTFIIEDSNIGYESAKNTRADTLRVVNSSEVTKKNIIQFLNEKENEIMKKNYKNDKVNVIIPMAGSGSRFQMAGYTFPKPLIEIKGKTMIEIVVESLRIDANYIFIVRREHDDKYKIENYLRSFVPNCKIVFTEGVTEGAASTVLLAKDLINNDNPILLANSDQYIEWDIFQFMKNNLNNNLDASMLVFESNHPKWSFAKVNEEGLVTEVAEKDPISNIATVGVYWWAKGSDFVKYAEQMIEENIRVNGEFYVCPVFNKAIEGNKRIGVSYVDEMWDLAHRKI